MTALHPIDWAFILGYFALVFGIAYWAYLKEKQSQTSTEYFLAGRNLGWWVIGASVFSSNIGSEHLVGLAGSGATDGVAMAHYELHAWCLLILGWVMVPFYMRSKVFTMPEFLERRFSPINRTVLSAISLVAYILTKLAVGIFAGGIVFAVLIPDVSFLGLDSFWIGSILVIVLTGVYTVLGGMRAVAYTSALQTVILVIGSALVDKASGCGHRVIAARLGRPVSTVRGWLRRFGSRAEVVRAALTALAVTLVTDAVLPDSAGSGFADAVAAVGAAASGAARRFGVPMVSGWRLACAVSAGRLLAPGWPSRSCNTSWPWSAVG